MFNEARKFLFRCTKCQLLLSIELDEQEEIEEVQSDQMVLECTCGAECNVLRD